MPPEVEAIETFCVVLLLYTEVSALAVPVKISPMAQTYLGDVEDRIILMT